MTQPDATETFRRLAVFLRPGRRSLILVRFWTAAALLLVSAGRASGQCGGCANMSFGPAGRSFRVTGQNLSVVSADFNGDGLPDVAVLNFQSVSIFLGDGTGVFSLSTTTALTLYPNSLAAGDLDGDAKTDLVIARGSFYNVNDPGGLTVLLGNGAGGIRSQSEVVAAVYPFAPVIADVNGDGRADLVVGSLSGPSHFVLAGDGLGGFGPPPPPPSPPFTGFASRVQVADLDGDGLLDVAVASGTLLKIFLGSGGGSFLPARNIPLDQLSYGIETVVTKDFNRDGIPDLALSDHYNSAILIGAGGGSFEPPAFVEDFLVGAAGDFNQDGIPDFVTGGRVYFGDGFGGLVAGPPVRLPGSSVFVMDVDSDGKDDLLAWDYWSGGIDVVRGVGAGLFESAPESPAVTLPQSVAAADFNGDGKPDLALASTTQSLAILLNGGDGAFGPPIQAPDLYGLTGIAAIDFNGDGKADVVATRGASYPAAILVSPGDGAGHLGSPMVYAVSGGGVGSLVVADVNGDHHPDVVAVIDGRILVRLNDGFGGLGPENRFGVPFATSVVAVGDVSGDGRPDIVALQGTTVQTYFGDGAGGFSPGPASAADNWISNSRLLLKDMNEDGKLDLFAFGDFSEVAWMPGNGSGGFGSKVVIVPYPSLIRDVAIEDFNGDGHAELAAFGREHVSFFRYVPGNSIQAFGAFAVPGTGGVSADFSGDGKQDLVGFTDSIDGAVWYLENTNCKPRRLALSRNVSSCNVAGAPLAVQPLARVTDDGGDLVGCDAGSVSAALVPGTGTPGAQLTGATSVPVVAGVATFSNLSVDLPGRGYRLRLTHSQAGVATSRSFSQSLPPPAIGLPADVCTGGLDRFEAAAGYDVYAWTLDGIVVGRSRVLTLSTLAGGTHSLQLSVMQDGCSASASVVLAPKVTPAAPVASSNSPVAFGGTLQLSSTNVPGAAYEWTGPNGFASTDRNPVLPNVTTAASGTYRVVARVNGCSSPAAATSVTVLPAPLCSGCAKASFDPAAKVFPTGIRAFRTALRDFDGDGNLDVLVANVGDFFQTQVTVYPGDGRGGFGPGVVTQFNFYQGVFAVADFNRDGLPDLVVDDLDGILLVPGIGGGRFGPLRFFATGFNPQDSAIGDFNEDGWPDIAVASSYDRKISILLGDGAGGFLPAASYPFAFGPSALTVGDFNGDHHLDIAFSLSDPVSSSLSVLLGNGSGGFTAGPSTPTASWAGSLVSGDFDGDGVPDLAAGGGIGNAPGSSPFGNISLFKGLGGGTFQFIRTVLTGAASALRVMDINGDGKADLVFLEEKDFYVTKVAVLTGRGGFDFDPRSSFFTGVFSIALDIGDVDRDGLPDAIVANGNSSWFFGGFILLRGVSAGILAITPVISVGDGAAAGAMVAADFNLDGHPDIAMADSRSGHISIFLNDGSGGLAPSSVLPDATRLRALASADFNGDGFPDLAATGDGSYGVAVYLNNGAGGFSGKTDYVGQGTSIAIADFNRDGKLDLALSSTYGDFVYILLGDGAGHFSFPTEVHGFPFPVGLVAGDFNRDGNPDFAVIGSSPSSLFIALGNGAGGFGSPSQIPLPSTPSFIVAGDFNLDGKLDLAVAHDRVSIFLGDGSGGFAAPSLVGPSGGIGSLAVGDWNNDGKPDLALTRPNGGDVFVLNGDGAGGFASSAQYLAGKSPTWVISADFDGDGRPDLGFSSIYYGDLTLLYNTNCVPRRLGVSASPSCPAPGQAFPVQPTARVRDDGDNVVPCDSRTVTAGIAPGTGTTGAVLGGTTAVSAVAGVAAFPNLSIDLAGTLYQLEFHHPVASRTRDAPFSVGAPPPAPAASNNGPICAGQTLTLSATSVAGALYRWTGPNGFTSTLRNPSIPNATTLASGTYSVTMTLNGCTAAPATTIATVIPTPASPIASNNGPICAGQTLQLSASAVPGATYAWTGPGGFTSTEQNPQIPSAPVSASGLYRVTATVNGCASPQATTSVVIRAPSAAISAPALVCPNSPGRGASVPSAGAGAVYVWTITNGTITSGPGTSAITFTSGGSGVVQLDVTVTDGFACSASGTKSVTIGSGAACGGNLIPDGRAVTATLASGGSLYRGPVTAGRSYCIEVEAPFDGAGTLGSGGPLPALAVTRSDGVTAVVSSSTASCEPAEAARISFTPSAADVSGGPLQFSVFDAGAGGYPIRVRLIETTMYCPRWSVNGFNALISLQNTSDCSVGGKVLLLDSTGVTLTTLSFNLGAGGAIQLTIPNGLPALFGPAILTHNGPPGAMTGGIYMVQPGAAGANFRWSFQETRSGASSDGR